MTAKPPATPTPTPAVDTVEYNYLNAPAIRAAKIADLHKAMTDSARGWAEMPEGNKRGRFVLADGTILERK